MSFCNKLTHTRQPIEIIVYGRPAPQGSKSYLGTRGGHGVLVESSRHVKPWRADVREAARGAIASQGGTWTPMDGPIVVRMIFTVRKPASAPKRRKTYPDRMPDLSKLIRSTEDALTDAGIWADDARVIEYERAAKVYPGEDLEALDAPGARIVIKEKGHGEIRSTREQTTAT